MGELVEEPVDHPIVRPSINAVAQTYDLAAPDIITLLRNATTSARTLTAKQGDLKQALSGLTGVSRSARLLLAENEEGIKAEGKAMLPVLNLLDTYSPEFPCLIEGISHQRANTANVFQNNRIHQTLELGAPQRKAYTAADKPVYGEVGHGPWCLGLPNPPEPIGPQPLKDGTDQDDNPPTSTVPGSGMASFARADTGYAGTPGDKVVVNAMLAERSGRNADSYGSLGSLMYGAVVL